MTPSRKLTSALLALFALVVMSASALAADTRRLLGKERRIRERAAGAALAVEASTGMRHFRRR